MAKMTIRVTNATFEGESSDEQFDSVDDAYAAAIRSGLEIAGMEIARGSTSSIVELAVDTADRRYAARGALAISTARLFTGD